MLNNKAEFLLEFNESQQITLKRTDVDWTQSKVLFISPQFTNYQREAINFKDLPIELWEIKRFENDSISFEQILKASAKESIRTISRNDETVGAVSKEVKQSAAFFHSSLQKAELDRLGALRRNLRL